ncbi:hypothetical protein SCLCIDRAFT_1218227 [Scleroderma citrinum Foug A]|uniref:G-protein coupled receptors family 1 profile domain-containing protein n=1 Tax=Scleroderma citrinum Foug A TaxID=1036808 RepID=A0A0C2ZAH4_9AGAM|nr:hypothetical protein SCLCIDRAFT_1218227 [Scleroderma citrinum Foug A]
MDGPPTSFLNPAVYLNYLDPNAAFDYEVTRNVYIATLGAMIWDILSCVQQDWKLLRISKPQPVFFAYYLSRLGTLSFTIFYVLDYTGPIENCQKLLNFSTACFFVSVASTDFLFLARVCAVYCHKKPIYITFILLWIVDVGVLCLFFTGLEVIPIANTKHCINVSKNEYVAASLLVSILFDTMVYIFVTAKLLSTRNSSEKKTTWRTIFSGGSLPRLSRAIMQGGQQYYLIKVVGSMMMIFFWLVPSIPSVYRHVVAVPFVGIASSMACRVYRKLKLELVDEGERQRIQGVTADAMFTTCVQVAPLTEVLITKDVEAATCDSSKPCGRSDSNYPDCT